MSVAGGPRRGAHRRMRPALLAAMVVVFAGLAYADVLPSDTDWTEDPEGRARLFDLVTGRVEALYWDPGHLDWEAWRERHRRDARRAETERAFDAVMRRAFEDLDDDHSRWLGRTPGLDVAPAVPDPEPEPEPEPEPGRSPGTPSVRGRLDEASSVAHLKLGGLTPGTAAQVHDEVARLRSDGARALVLDVRGNPGGSVTELGLILGMVGDGAWVEARGRDGVSWTLEVEEDASLAAVLRREPEPGRGEVVARDRLTAWTRWQGPLAVLVDGGTASAAEALAGALVRREGVPAVGRPTPDNVETVQRVSFPAGRAAWLAVGELRMPGGASLAPVPLTSEVREDGGGDDGWDAAFNEAVRLLRDLPAAPGRWFGRSGALVPGASAVVLCAGLHEGATPGEARPRIEYGASTPRAPERHEAWTAGRGWCARQDSNL